MESPISELEPGRPEVPIGGEAAPARPRFWNVPNTLTVARLALGVVVLGLIAAELFLGALVVFIVAALTDAFDGYLARRMGQATAIGRQLDPLVDKLLIAGVFIYLLVVPGSGLAPWMVTAVVIRELLIQWLRSLLEGRGEAFGARMAGKLKTTFQCLAVVASLLGLALGLRTPAWFLLLRDGIIWTAVGLTIYSGMVYVVIAWPRLQSKSRPDT